MSIQTKRVESIRRGQTAIPGWAVLIVSAALSLSGCGGGGGGGGSSTSSVGSAGCNLPIQELEAIGNINDIPHECLSMLPTPEDNLLGRMFILGTQIDSQGALRIFVNGTDSNGNPLQLADYQSATVSIDGITANPKATVEPVAAGDDVLSLGFLTDYSTSISDAELATVSDIYSLVLDNLIPPNLPNKSLPGSPPILEGMVINFSNSILVKQDWTDDPALLQAAYQLDAGFSRQNTALYDALGVSLLRDPGEHTDGLVERCRPAHMLVTFTDGADNASFTYTRETLLPIIDDSKAVMIMLGSLSADKTTLMDLAGDQGAFVYAYNLSGIQSTVEKWANSLSQMVIFTLDSDTNFDAGTITLKLGEESVVVERPVDGFCESQ